MEIANVQPEMTIESHSKNDNASPGTAGAQTHLGSCHCGAVRFEADLDVSAGGARCNCTICTKIAQVGTITQPSGLRLLSGEESLSMYEWGGKTGKRFFCKQCGIHVFGRGHLKELGGDYASVNLNAIDDIDVGTLTVSHWDGRHNNWYAGTRPTPWPIAPA
jgi:hypothetical protein